MDHAGPLITRYRRGEAGVLTASFVADLDTPVGAFLKLTRGCHHSFLLESVEGGAVRGRYSIIGTDPDLIWRVRGASAEIGRLTETGFEFQPHSLAPLDSLRRLIADSHIALPDNLPPMAAGLAGFLGYDMVRQMERLPAPRPDPLGLPTAQLVRPRLTAIVDTVTDRITLVAPLRPDPAISAEAADTAARARLDEAIQRLQGPLPSGLDQAFSVNAPEDVSDTPAADYLSMVDRAKAYIRAGDIFQVVLSQNFSAPFDLPAFALYRALRRTNPSPYMYFLADPDFCVVGSSPEIMARMQAGRVTVRPIAGTRPRGLDREDDQRLEQELLADPKELAEHLMLLDLGRNDAGRVSVPGSVEVTARNVVERYSHVMHIVSNVEGRLRPGADAVDVVKATFPAGTVCGAPKIRAMQIIDELEKTPRGIYAGMVGYFGADGSMDSAIVLRTAVVKDGVMHVRAGAGLVADSVPQAEQAECTNKARALFRAAEEAVRYARQGEV
ncbi:MAG: anthranilate synthase component I [Rhodothalassiaceae bacterium]